MADFDWESLLKQAPAIANLFNSGAAVNQNQQRAADFTQQADKYGQILNPYGSYRDAAAQKLQALQADPSSVANTPGYKFALDQGLGAVGNRDIKRFGVGAGSTNPDLMGFAQGLASKTYNDTVKQYSDQAGVGIGPNAAASIYQTGMLGNLASQAASDAAKGGTLTSGANLLAGLSGPAASLFKSLTSSGMSPAAAAQIAKAFGGGSANVGGVVGGSSGAGSDANAPGNAGNYAGDPNPPDTSPGSGFTTDQYGNTVQIDNTPASNFADGISQGGVGEVAPIDWSSYFFD